MARGSAHAVGNVNLRGKKSATLSCGCCGIDNLKEKYQLIEDLKQIDEFFKNL